jgi:hypothetical protein
MNDLIDYGLDNIIIKYPKYFQALDGLLGLDAISILV